VSAFAPDTSELYRRFKALTVAASAALILGERVVELRPKVAELQRDAAGTPCEEPATQLRRLVDGAMSSGVSEEELDSVRSSHRRLRREVWSTQPCEYVPCCAGAHDHR
jgi:hypothetical protein